MSDRPARSEAFMLSVTYLVVAVICAGGPGPGDSEGRTLFLVLVGVVAVILGFKNTYRFARANGVGGGWVLAPLVLLFGHVALWQKAKQRDRAARIWLALGVVVIVLLSAGVSVLDGFRAW